MGSRLEKNSNAVRKRIEAHTFTDEGGDEYEASNFGGFGEYMRRKKIKLQNLDAERRERSFFNDGKPAIFRGVVAHVNGYTQPSLNDLHRLIVDYGGGFLQYLDGKTVCTHIIAANITPKKREEFKRYRVVKPAWVVDSIKAGKLLPWDHYRVIEDVKGQRTLGFDDGKIVSQASTADKRSYKEQTNTSWYAEQVNAKAQIVDDRPHDDSTTNFEVGYRATMVPADLGDDRRLKENVSTEAPGQDDELSEQQEAEPAQVTHESTEPTGLTEMEADVQARVDDTSLQDSDGHARKKASYLTAADMRPDDAGDWQRTKSPVFKNPKTAEEHNANLLADPKIRKSTVVNPAFLKQYYEESRLHHLSTWKAELKAQLQALAEEQSSSQKARHKRPKGARRYILHVDFDSFFVAVSLLKHPEFKDVPTVVAHGGGSGSEIASCNYPARKYGVKNGMWMKRAQELCSDIKVLPYDFKAYEDASRKFYKAIMDTGGIVQSVSIDEALIDISALCIEAGGHDGKDSGEGAIYREQARADELAQGIRDQVKDLTGCAVSVGIGANILQAKLALRKAKPAGQYQLRPEEVLEFIGDLTVQELPGVAYNMGNKLEEIGIKYIKDIRETSKEKLISTMGPKTGEKLWEYSRGIDRVEVGEQTIRKSVSAEVNWGIRFATQEQAEDFIRSICEELEKRLVSEAVKGRQFTMKIMRRARDAPLDPPKHLGHGKCDVFNKSVVLGVATNDKAILSREALSLLKGFGFPPGELRGIGVQMTKLEPLKGTRVLPESSQRLLSFDKAAQSPASKQAFGIAGFSEPATPNKARVVTFADPDEHDSGSVTKIGTTTTSAAATIAESETPSTRVPVLQSNDEVDSPHKFRVEDRLGLITPKQGKEAMLDDSILNTTGTQFILPSQADPEVIAALPEDIRLRFARASAIAREKQEMKQEMQQDDFMTRSESPLSVGFDGITESQIDPETLAELPEDVRIEILAQYRQRGSPHPARQAVLPQSPRSGRLVKIPNKRVLGPGRQGGLLSRGRGHKAPGLPFDVPTLTQANFVFSKPEMEELQTESQDELEDVPPIVLDKLPAEIREEIMEQKQPDRLRKKGGPDVAERKKQSQVPDQQDTMMQLTLEFERRPPKPTFTARQLSTLPELREVTTSWFEGTEDSEVAMEDVDLLAVYLRRVVLEEKDMHKAVAVVKWLLWLIDSGGQEAEKRWEVAIAKLKSDVQAAITERGLGKVEF